MRKKLTIRLMWFAVIAGMISFFGLFILAANGVFGEMPEFEQLENPNTNLENLMVVIGWSGGKTFLRLINMW